MSRSSADAPVQPSALSEPREYIAVTQCPLHFEISSDNESAMAAGKVKPP